MFLSGETRNRTEDTTIFSRVLYQLSYLAKPLQIGNFSLALRTREVGPWTHLSSPEDATTSPKQDGLNLSRWGHELLALRAEGRRQPPARPPPQLKGGV